MRSGPHRAFDAYKGGSVVSDARDMKSVKGEPKQPAKGGGACTKGRGGKGLGLDCGARGPEFAEIWGHFGLAEKIAL